MKTKIFFEKMKVFRMILIVFCLVFLFASAPQSSIAQYKIDVVPGANAAFVEKACYDNNLLDCSQNYASRGVLAENLVYMFLALILWTISPVGVLFFWAYGILLSKNSSWFKRKIACFMQIFAFLFWASLMTILLLAYLDSITYNVFSMGGRVLNIAITSGIAFVVVMFFVMFIERKQEEREASFGKSGSGKEKKNGTGKCFGNFERNGGKAKSEPEEIRDFGDKVKDILKRDIKEIIDDAIDKWL